MSLLKKTTLGLVVVIGVANLGALIGHTIRQPVQPAQVNYPPAGDYTSYTVTVNPDGSYTIDYRAHDPTIVGSETYVDTSNGVFGIGGRSTTTRNNQYIAGGESQGGKNNARSEECIKAEGGGESNGALVGASLGAAAAPMLTSIPYVGWLAAGWAVMFGQDMGSSVGGEISSTIKGC